MSRGVCIIGGAGFLGAEVRRSLAGFGVRAPLTIVDKVRPAMLFEGEQFIGVDELRQCRDMALSVRAVVSLAAPLSVAAVSPSAELSEFVDANLAPLHVVGTALSGTVRWIHVSSISVYKPRERGGFLEADPKVPPSAYGVGKLAAERYLQCACARRAEPLIVLRLPDLYGSAPAEKDQRLLPSLLRAAVFGTPWRLLGDGTEKLDLLHVHDAAAAVVTALHAEGDPAGAYNVGSGGVTLRNVIQVVEDAASVNLHLTPGKAVRPDRFLNDSAFRLRFSWDTRVALRDGISHVVEAMRGLQRR